MSEGMIQTDKDGFEGSRKMDRKEVVQDVFSDYLDLLDNMHEENLHFVAAKSAKEYDQVEQSYIQHIRNGVETLMLMYWKLPEDHFFVDEKMLRQTIGLFCTHDYHKTKAGMEDEFEITLDEADMFAEAIGIDAVWNTLDEDENASEAIRGVMAAHHMTNSRSKKSTVPSGYYDHFYMVLFADALASKTTYNEAVNDEDLKTRANKALQKDYSIVGHSLDRKVGNTSMLVNKAVAEVLEEEGYMLVKVFDDGCLYIKNSNATRSFDSDITDRVLHKFTDEIKEAHPQYNAKGFESSSFEKTNGDTRYYPVTVRDMFYIGLENCIKGIVQKGVTDSNDMKEATDFMEQAVQNKIAPRVDKNIHTETRRVEGVASAVHSVYRVLRAITDQINGGDEPEWRKDPVLATMKVFEVYSNEEAKENVKTLMDEGREPRSRSWYYKYLIAQYTYEEHFTGTSQEEMIFSLGEEVAENVVEYFPLESKRVEEQTQHIEGEIRSYLGINVIIDGDKLADFRNEDEIADSLQSYLRNGDKNDCAYCTWGTTADETDNALVQDLDRAEEIEVNVTGSGTHETVNTGNHEEPFCFMCQIEISLRQTLVETWGDSEQVYAHFKPEYSFVPTSAYTFKKFLDYQTNLNDGSLTIQESATDFMSDSLMKPVQDLHHWTEWNRLDRISSLKDAFNPEVPYGGHGIPIGKLSDEDLYEKITAVGIAAAGSGVGVRISTRAMSQVKYDYNEILAISDKVSENTKLYEDNVPLENLHDVIEDIALLHDLCSYLSKGHSIFNDEITAIDHIGSFTNSPVHRVARMAMERGYDLNGFHHNVGRLEQRFSYKSPIRAIAKEMELYIDAIYDSPKKPYKVGLVEDTLKAITQGVVSNGEAAHWAKTKILKGGDDSEFDERLAERFASCVTDLQSENERFICIQTEVCDVIEVNYN